MDFPASPINSGQYPSSRDINFNKYKDMFLKKINSNIINKTNEELFDIQSFMEKSINEQSNILNSKPEIINYIEPQTGNNILFYCIEKNNYSLAKILLEKNPQLINYKNKYNETPLHKAVEVGNHQMINLLLEKNANPNIQNKFGETPLHITASKGEYKVIKLLLLYNSDPNILTNEGFSAEDYAIERGHTKCVNVLREKNKNNIQNQSFNVGYQLKFNDDLNCSDLMTPQNKKIANGMEKSPIHQNRIFLSSKCKNLNLFNNYFDKYCNNNNNQNNNNNNNLRESFLVNKSNNRLTIHKSLSNTVIENKEKLKICEDLNIDNNIFISSKDIMIPEESDMNSNIEQEPLSPFQIIRSDNDTTKTNDLIEENCKSKLNLNEYFYDDSIPIKVFHSQKNDIKCKENLRETTKESINRYNLRSNNTLRNTLRNSIIRSSVIREENSSSEEFNNLYFIQNNNKNIKNNNNNNNINNTSNDSIYSSNNIKESLHSGETQIKENEEEEEILIEYLSQIHMDKYSSLLIKEGFDDVTVLVELMKGKKAITDIDLKNIGISIAGDRARILIKLQLDACENEFKFNNFLNENAIFYVTNYSEKEFKKDNYLKELYKWLQNIKLQNLFSNFYQQGYFSVDLLLIQMLSKNPITDEILKDDLKINKYGYRLRLMNKLLDDSSQYFKKYKRLSTKSSGIDFQISERKASCECNLF